MKRREFFRGTALASAGLFFFRNDLIAGKPEMPERLAHKILSCNIRVALPVDDAKGLGWDARKKLCRRVIQRQNPDIICLQEVLKIQDADMREFFPGYVSFGFQGPDMDRFSEGYHGIAKNTILFSKRRYELVSEGCFWLSETPHIAGSMSWGTARARHANWVRLKDRRTQKEFRVVNIHLDHISEAAREAQMKMIVEESAQYQTDFPQILAGDFNTGFNSPVLQQAVGAGWNDSYSSVHGDSDPGFTYHAFKGEEYDGKNKGRIDFILTRGKAKTLGAQVIRDNENGFFPSDHYFISADIILK
ncbi:Metal-dependent hydrolase, endonuclease/exonuclease/phosphatase family [Mariniphaga anaerophila]|uniref:Metal-dependent hydrolase, endonuclease/exonuclease/phosphatase family n=1 Tax=Mariniphaga anaerophila TaxID=1484053 RepID=A0A1M5DY36_9BACT|nr:endonuclease/exonuclease/phosphatase family protein [Mariniphaga anaerophila]SHF71917.1 Metal-dependent hydrolase, endonuclease/exonuclease/phosphatase family [Mariniphaga anaerophila]